VVQQKENNMRVQAAKDITVNDLLSYQQPRPEDDRVIIEAGTVGDMVFNPRSGEDLPMAFYQDTEPGFWNVKSSWFVKV
jgi:hypothetical protein